MYRLGSGDTRHGSSKNFSTRQKGCDMKTTILLAVGCLLLSTTSHAANVAQCSNPVGQAYYPYLGLMEKKTSGWTDDKITGGITTLRKIGKNQYDLLFVDSFKQIISTIQDGGKVYLYSKGTNNVSFLVLYPGKTVEVFTFLVNNDGKAEYTYVSSRAGDGVLFPKATVMRGDCQFVKFGLVD